MLELLATGEWVSVEETVPVPDPVPTVLPTLPNESEAISTPDEPIFSPELAPVAWERSPWSYKHGFPLVSWRKPGTNLRIYIAFWPAEDRAIKQPDGTLGDAVPGTTTVNIAMEGDVGDSCWIGVSELDAVQVTIEADELAKGLYFDGTNLTAAPGNYLIPNPTVVKVWDTDATLQANVEEPYYYPDRNLDILMKDPTKSMPCRWQQKYPEYRAVGLDGSNTINWHGEGAVYIWGYINTQPCTIEVVEGNGTTEVKTMSFFEQLSGRTNTGDDYLKEVRIWFAENADTSTEPDLVVPQPPCFEGQKQVLLGDTFETKDLGWSEVYQLDNWVWTQSDDGLTLIGMAPGDVAYVKVVWTDVGYDVEAQGLRGDAPWSFQMLPFDLSINTLQTGGNEGRFSESYTQADCIGLNIRNWKVDGSRYFWRPIEASHQGWIRTEHTRFGIPVVSFEKDEFEAWIFWTTDTRATVMVKGGSKTSISDSDFWHIESNGENKGMRAGTHWSDNALASIKLWEPGVAITENPSIEEPRPTFKLAEASSYCRVPDDWYFLTMSVLDGSTKASWSLDHVTTYCEFSFGENRTTLYCTKERTQRQLCFKAWTINNDFISGTSDGFKLIDGEIALLQVWFDMTEPIGDPDFILGTYPALYENNLGERWQQYLDRLAYLETTAGRVETLENVVNEVTSLIGRGDRTEPEKAGVPVVVDVVEDAVVIKGPDGYIDLTR